MGKKVLIAALIDTQATLDEAFRNPALRIKANSAKRPTLDQATKAVLQEVEMSVIDHIQSELEPVLNEAYETHVLCHGEREDAEVPEEWDEMVDELAEEAITPYTEVLSQDWLGRNTIGTAFHLEGGIAKFCASLGREYFKQLTYDEDIQESPPKILSSAGITKADIEARLEIHNNPTKEESEAMSEQQNEELEAVLLKIATHVGKDHDQLEVYNDVDLCSDDDEVLANGAAPRLGIEEADLAVLQTERVINGPEAVQAMCDRIIELGDGSKAKKAPKAKKAAEPKPAPAPKAAKKPAKAPAIAETAPVAAEGAVITPEVLNTLKDCGGKDAELALGIGTSRATYNNYVNGKSEFKPTVEQHNFIRQEVVDRINALHEALATLDGTEAEVVY